MLVIFVWLTLGKIDHVTQPRGSSSGGPLDRDGDFAMKLLDESYLVRPEMLCMSDLGGYVRLCECKGE
jgi:hypothetical protein